MKRFLISSTLIVALGFAGAANADGYRGHGHPPGVQKQLERGKALPPGHQRKALRSEWRQDKHDRRSDKNHRDQRPASRYDRHDHRDKYPGKDRGKHRDSYRDRNAYRDRNHDNRYRAGHRASFSHPDRLTPEYRAARIIRDTQILIGQSRH